METLAGRAAAKIASETVQLIALGHTSRKQGDYESALQHFTAAAAAAPSNHVAALHIAQTLVELKRPDEAEIRFRAVLTLAPGNLAALAGLGNLALRRGDNGAALEWLQSALAMDPQSIDLQMKVGRALQLLGRLDAAEACFVGMLESKPDHAKAQQRLGEIAHSRGDLAAALAWFERAAANEPRNLAVRMNAGRVLKSLARYDAAEACFLAVLEQDPQHEDAQDHLGDVARLRGDLETALARFQAAQARAPGKRHQLQIAAVLCAMRRFDEADCGYHAILQANPDDVDALVGIGAVELNRGNAPAALAHLERAATKDPDNPKILFHIAGALRYMSRFDEAATILARAGSLGHVDKAEFRVKQFEMYCSTMQFVQAERCLLNWQGHRHVPANAVVSAAQLYAALGRWSDVLAFFRERVIEGRWTGRSERLFEPLLRAARATGRYEEALELLGAMIGTTDGHAVRDAQEQIVEEMRLLRLLDPKLPKPNPEIDTALSNPLRVQRAELFARVLQGSGRERRPVLDIATMSRGSSAVRRTLAPHARTQIYMCADAAYMIGASVCMFSLFKHNGSSLPDCDYTVFCDDQMLDLGTAVFGEIGDAFGIPIATRASGVLVSSDSDLRTEWGFFVPGRALSRAAYYRIYAALKLIDEGMSGRALYIDSDTRLFSGLEQLIAFDLDKRPLGVCLDDADNFTIRRAALLLGLQPERYFNSGVLLFDLSHPELRATLDRSIEISLTEQHRLSFVDQCALNLAFCDKFATMPRRFNMMVDPHTAPEDILADPLVMHFITQPKPWDPMYATANGTPWLRALAEMGEIVAPDLIKQLFAVQYPAILASGQRSGTHSP
jgi:tetratricopeptide (TPR) repeat protein